MLVVKRSEIDSTCSRGKSLYFCFLYIYQMSLVYVWQRAVKDVPSGNLGCFPGFQKVVGLEASVRLSRVILL